MAVGANGDVPPTFPVVMGNPGDQAGLMVHELEELQEEQKEYIQVLENLIQLQILHRRKGSETTENNTMSIQIQTWYKYKYLIEGRVEEFDTTTENNTMLIQIQSWYLYK